MRRLVVKLIACKYREIKMLQRPDAITLPPDESEMRKRLERVQKQMAEQDLDVYVSYDPVNVYYLTNFYNFVHERPFILVIGKEGIPRFVVPKLEIPHVRSRAKCQLELHQYFEYPAPTGENWFDVYAGLIDKNQRVGVESAMTLEIFDKTPGTRIKTDIIDEVRYYKTDFEIGKYAYACQTLSSGYEKLIEICRPGKTMAEINRTVSQFISGKVISEIKEFNGYTTSVVGLVSPPSISDDPHNFTDLFQPMEHGGPHVCLVVGQIDGCGVELERTFFLGSVPEAAKRPFEVMLAARSLAYDMLKPGTNMSDLDVAVNKVLKDAGYGENLLHRTGHGIGITGHEGPFLAEGFDRELEPGMMVSIEPGIYISGIGGFRFSDCVLVTDDGYLKLTSAPETLAELTIPI